MQHLKNPPVAEQFFAKAPAAAFSQSSAHLVAS
jgi:hypothetical protein